MSKTLDKLRRPGAALFLRRPDGSFQGPIESAELIKLAAANRIPPGSEVSDDGATWEPAELMPELKMEWIARIADGRSYGPFNLLALPHLISNGTVPEEADIVNTASGKTVHAADVCRAAYKRDDNRDGSPEDVHGKQAEALQSAAPKVELKTEYRKIAEQEHGRDSGDDEKKRDRQVDEMRHAVESAADRFKDVAKKLQDEQAAHSRTVAENSNKEKLHFNRIASLEEQVRSLQFTLAQVRADAEKQRRWDQSMLDEARKAQAETVERANQLRNTVEDSNARAREAAERLSEEQAARTAASDEARRAEIRLNEKIMRLEEDARAKGDVLAQARMEAEKQRQRDQSLLEMSRQKENELAQRCEEAMRLLDAKTSDLLRVKSDFDREKAAHEETRKNAGEKERGLSTRLNDSEDRSRVMAANLKQAEQAAAERKERLDTLQREYKNKEQELTSRINEMEKTAENSARRMRELSTKIEEEESSFALSTRGAMKKEQDLNDKIARLKEEAGASSALIAQTRAQMDDMRKQNLILQDQSRSRETRLGQRIEELQAELSKANAQIELSRIKKIEEKPQKPLADNRDPEREKHLAALVARLEKQTADQSRLLDQSRSEAARLQADNSRMQKQAADIEASLVGQISSLKKTIEEFERKAAAEVSREDDRNHNAVISEAQARIADLDSQVRQFRSEIGNLNSALAGARREAESASREKDGIQSSLEKLSSTHNKLKDDHARALDSLKHKSSEPNEAPSSPPADAASPSKFPSKVAYAGIALLCFALGLWLRGIMIHTRPDDQQAVNKSSIQPPAQNPPPKQAGAAPAQIAPARQPGQSQTFTEPVQTKMAVAPPVAPVSPVRPSKSWPAISVEGATISEKNNKLNIVFDYGVFTYLAIISSRAKTDLASIAMQINGQMGEYKLEVDGTTDSVPLGSSAAYTNNYELGMARAEAVVDYLVNECKLPASSLVATSSGDTNPPFPNTDIESRKKNRTVVLKLVPARR